MIPRFFDHHWAPRLLAAVLVLLAAGAQAVVAQGNEGRSIQIRGTVTDREGRPLPEVTVVFRAARVGIMMRDLRMDRGRTEEIRATTDRRGIYTIEWTRDPFFNSFDVRVETELRRSDGERTELLAHRDLPDLRATTNTVVANLQVRRASLVRELRTFVAGLDSADERQLYERLGKPDRVERITYQGTDRIDASWWYFRRGEVYYFRSGELVDERSFDPVRPF